ncbi:penicillin-binding transpeptidase domain-containing protein [Streptomyces sp. M10(2022)]
MDPATAAQLQQMMADVVENGTGTNAAIDGVTVGGKTGTAQHGVDNTGTPYAWFISWAQEPDSGRPPWPWPSWSRTPRRTGPTSAAAAARPRSPSR